jgi:hypothetical protein
MILNLLAIRVIIALSSKGSEKAYRDWQSLAQCGSGNSCPFFSVQSGPRLGIEWFH